MGVRDGPGLTIQLSDGQEVPSVIERLVPVKGVPLTAEEIEEILARLTPWAEDQGLEVDFRLPDQILPPPITGETIPEIISQFNGFDKTTACIWRRT